MLLIINAECSRRLLNGSCLTRACAALCCLWKTKKYQYAWEGTEDYNNLPSKSIKDRSFL